MLPDNPDYAVYYRLSCDLTNFFSKLGTVWLDDDCQTLNFEDALPWERLQCSHKRVIRYCLLHDSFVMTEIDQLWERILIAYMTAVVHHKCNCLWFHSLIWTEIFLEHFPKNKNLIKSQKTFAWEEAIYANFSFIQNVIS